MFSNIRRIRNIQRYHKIVAVFARHGFGTFLESLDVHRYLPLPIGILRQTAGVSSITPAEHLRLALEELGPTFIKMGQILSTRPDLFPSQYIVELTKLQDSIPPTPWPILQDTLKEEYSRPLEEIFTSIDPTPLGSASLAQVHAAVLHNQRSVVIKIQRPEILKTIEADLDILTDLATIAQRSSWGQVYRPAEIITQFAFTLHNELDYRREGLNADRFRANFHNVKQIYIPEVYWEYSTPRVLVMERLEGIRIDELQALDEAGYDRHAIATDTTTVLIKEILEDGFFHADPHPGNFVIMPGATAQEAVIGAMDFGMVGTISKSGRIDILQTCELAVRADARGLVGHIQRMGVCYGPIDDKALERDIDRLLQQYRDLPLKYIESRRVMTEFMQLAFQYHISLPPDLWLLFKTLVMLDGLARQLDPEFDVFAEFTPHIRQLIFETRMPWNWGPGLMNDAANMLYAMRDIPTLSESMLRSLQRGQLPFSFTVGGNKESLDRLDRLGTRFSLSILTAAFILGLALLFPAANGSPIARALIIIGFILALAMGIWVVFSILRSGK